MTAQELKNSILQRAFTGKLSIQNKTECVEKSKIDDKKNKNIKDFEFDLPDNWALSTIEGISKTIPTKKYQIKQTEVLSDGEFPVISQSNEFITGYYNDLNKVYKHKESVVIFGDHTTVVKYIDFDFVVGADGVKIFEPFSIVDAKYLYYCLSFITIGLDKLGRYSRHYKFIKDEALPLPPLAEQKRIVEKLEELMPLVERYDESWQRLEDLDKRFPETLKKSLLQEAIKGRLVEQKAEEGTGEELYKLIQKEKKKLIKIGTLKKQKALPEIKEDEIPFEIPKTWKWVRLGELTLKITDGAHSTPTYTKEGVPFLSVKDISSGKIDYSDCKFISQEEHEKLFERCNPEKGDLLLTKVGTTGIPVVVETEDEFSLFVSVALLKFPKKLIDVYFLKHLINSPLVQVQSKENTRGVGNKNWVMRDIANTIIPLPPLAEQKRIVEKLEELMPLCEQLTRKTK